MSKATFGRRLSTALQSYRKNGENIKNLLIEAIEFASQNNHQTVYCQKILDAMEGNDIRDVSLILTKYAPFTITDGTIALKKSKKDRSYNIDHAAVDLYKSFRSLAESMRGGNDDAPTFDAAKYAATVAKKLVKEGMTVEQFEQLLEVAAADTKETA